MNVFIEVIEGADKGLRFKAIEGLRIGRSVGEIIINDGKISSLHAQVEKDKTGKLVLQDLESSNGIYIDARRIKKVLLIEGVTFSLGTTKFKVFVSPKNISPKVKVESNLTPTDISNDLLVLEPDLSSWKKVLNHHLSDYKIRHFFQPKINLNLKAFKSPILLKFIAGMQTEDQWILGWGPRTIGRDTLEFRLLDPVCPDVAFTISPNSDGSPIFTTPSPRLVLCNENSLTSCELNHGDHIQIGDNIIEIIIIDASEVGLEMENE